MTILAFSRYITDKHDLPEKAKAELVCFVTAFLLPFCSLNLENRMTVCMEYPAMTLRRRAGKRRRKGAGKPCKENGAPNINWSKCSRWAWHYLGQ